MTIVAWQCEMLFGDVVNGESVLNELGEIVREEWERTPVLRPNVELGEYIVMPNHIHGFLLFVDDIVGATRRVAPTLKSGSLGAVMAQFKSIVTKRINGLRSVTGLPVWQRNYYEHIIRDDREMDRIHRYIESNPSMWAKDDSFSTFGQHLERMPACPLHHIKTFSINSKGTFYGTSRS